MKDVLDSPCQAPGQDLQEVSGPNDLERAMNRARDLRSRHCGKLLAAAFRRLGAGVLGLRSGAPSGRMQAASRGALVIGAAALAGLVVSSDAALGQEKQEMAARASEQGGQGDSARLAALGLSPGTIDVCEDEALLWRAVRELVLPQRVSEPIQQRILRRLWIVDPGTRQSSFVDSTAN